jgi:hypothetical protein
MTGPTRKATVRVGAEIERAVGEARAAYEFVPNSFTYSCLHACVAAVQALEVLREALEAEGDS